MNRLIVVMRDLRGSSDDLSELIERALLRSEYRKIIDRCSGSGGSVMKVLQILRRKDQAQDFKGEPWSHATSALFLFRRLLCLMRRCELYYPFNEQESMLVAAGTAQAVPVNIRSEVKRCGRHAVAASEAVARPSC